jgi:hypothetical protein
LALERRYENVKGMERGKYEQLMYDIWYDQLKPKSYQIGSGDFTALTGRAGYVEFHITLVKKVYKDRDSEDVFKEMWEKQK